jgi:hypothetical protein
MVRCLRCGLEQWRDASPAPALASVGLGEAITRAAAALSR